MKFSGFENIDAGVRSAILISVAASYFAFDLGFEFGAHHDHFMTCEDFEIAGQHVPADCSDR